MNDELKPLTPEEDGREVIECVLLLPLDPFATNPAIYYELHTLTEERKS